MFPAHDADTSLTQVSTRQLPPGRGRGAWDAAVGQVLGPFVTDFGAEFEGRLDVRTVAGLSATRIIHNARAARRGRR